MILIETGDVDKDGKISLSDFRGMLNFNAVDPLAAPGNEALGSGEAAAAEEGGGGAADAGSSSQQNEEQPASDL